MIITVTMNPAIDKTVEVETFVHGGLNRIGAITIDAGGKGINVSKTIHALGGESLAMGFLGGTNGKVIQNVLKQQNIPNAFIQIEGETRVNTKIVEKDGVVTELNEQGPTINDNEIMELLESMEPYLHEGTLVVLSGSIPFGVTKELYGKMTEYIHKKHAKVFVDADGEVLEYALKAKPDIIKPNKVELEKYFGEKLESKEAIVNAGRKLLEQGVETVIISMGAEGAYFMTEKHTLYSPGLSVKAHSTVGAGDAMVAAFSYGLEQSYNMDMCVKLAMATSAGAVMTVGTKPPTRIMVDTLMEQVSVTDFVEN